MDGFFYCRSFCIKTHLLQKIGSRRKHFIKINGVANKQSNFFGGAVFEKKDLTDKDFTYDFYQRLLYSF